ncbi:hypothetical protein BJY01DRAFT_217955 [Aspergillus pseudoustus]|uniref:Uncharacterized protein n=1 Tax=Aspergillus pseudoustus TaxID=1810923 RepID=A0ABR4JPZ2_9EURO
MYFSKLIPAALFAALATAAPAPQSVSVDYAQIQAFSQNLQGICSNIDSSLSSASGDFNNLIGGFQGSASQSLQQLWSQVGDSNKQLQQACAQIISGLNGASESYQQSESDNAATFTGALAGLAGKA